MTIIETKDDRAGLPSASGMAKLIHCPGSRAAESNMPDLPEQDVTKTGNAVHASLAGEDLELELTEAEIKSNLGNMEKRATEQFSEEFSLGKPSGSYRETRLWIRNRQTLDLVASAKPDVVYVFETHACTWNYKTGFANQDDASVDWQSRTEALAIWHEHPELELTRAGKLSHRLTSKVDFADYTRDDLKRIEFEISHAIWRSDQPDAPRVPGKHCRWCKAQADPSVCPEHANYITTPLALVTGSKDQLNMIAKIGSLPVDMLGYYYRRKSDVNATFDIMEARLKSLPVDQLKAAGYELKPGNKKTEITDVGAAFVKLGEVLTPEERLTCIDLVRGRAVELVAKKQDISKDKAKAAVHELLAPWLLEGIGNPRLKSLK